MNMNFWLTKIFYLKIKAATIKRFECYPLGKAFEKQTNVIQKQTEVINKKEDKKNKLSKGIVVTNEKYRDQVSNALLYLPKKQVEHLLKLIKEWNLKI